EAQAEVLAHPIDGEAEVEFVGDHRFPAIFHLPRLGGALADDVEATLDVESCFVREVDSLGERLDESGDAYLVEHLRKLAAARTAHQRDRASIVGEHRRRGAERRFVAADHDGELAVFRARLAARYRRVEK